MGLADTLVGWRDFYAVAAGASATLVGLVFVGVSIKVGRQPLDARARLLGTMAVVNLLHPFWVSLAMLAPVPPVVTAAAFAPAAFVVLMFVVGTENAWDLLLGTGLGPRDRRR